VHHLWTELLLAAWFASGAIGAALLGSSNRAGIGFLLGLVGGPLGLVVAYRMKRAAPAGGALPKDGRFGANILAYRPPPPRPAATLAWPVLLGAGLVIYVLARQYYSAWIGVPLSLVIGLLGTRLSAGLALPVVGVFEDGLVIGSLLGSRFVRWRDLREIEYYPPAPAPGPAGTHEQRSVWIFSRRRGAAMSLSVPTAGYVNVNELNAVLQARAPLRVVTPESRD
jgi:hypothetical protein